MKDKHKKELQNKQEENERLKQMFIFVRFFTFSLTALFV